MDVVEIGGVVPAVGSGSIKVGKSSKVWIDECGVGTTCWVGIFWGCDVLVIFDIF